MYRAVIFDVDGTLVDSNDAHATAWVMALAERGRRVTFSRVRPLIGMGGDKLLPEVAGIAAASPEGQAIDARRREIFQSFLPHLKPTRGAKDFLEWLRDDRLTLVVASSASKPELHALLCVAGMEADRLRYLIRRCEPLEARSGHRPGGARSNRLSACRGDHDRRHAV
jgi:beta-phosphoglucomutase-like phosphatase (HAD superfamily)